MNRFLKYWRITGRSEVFRARVVTYADDFVILSRGCAAEALNWTYYYMGVWRAPKAKLVRIEEIGDDAPQKPEDVVAEINSGGYEKKFGQRRVPT